MKVTAIKAAVKTAGRFNIFIDGAYSFSLDELQLVSSGVRLGKEYSETELASLKRESEFGKAYARALEYIMRRPRSIKELRDYGWRKSWEPEMLARVIERLTAKGYLDEARFAQAWVRHRALGKPMSTRRIRLELKQKGVDDDIIEVALGGSEELDEHEALRKLIEKKRSRYSDEQKLIAYAARQGYDFDSIKQVLAEIKERAVGDRLDE